MYFCKFGTLPLGQWCKKQFTAYYYLLGAPEIIMTCFVFAFELMITYFIFTPELSLFKTQSPKFPWQLKGWQNGVFSCQTYEWWTCQSTKGIHSWTWMVNNVSCLWSHTLTTATSSSKNKTSCSVQRFSKQYKISFPLQVITMISLLLYLFNIITS